MTTYWDDLGTLTDIYESINAPKINLEDIEDDLKESLYLFLKEYGL